MAVKRSSRWRFSNRSAVDYIRCLPAFCDHWCRSKWGDAARLACECSGPSIKRCLGHSEIAGNLRSGVAAFDQADSTSYLTVSDPAGPAAKVPSGFSAFADGIGDAFAFDLVFHLRESGHDREQHRPHGCRGVHVATTKIQDAQARSPVQARDLRGRHTPPILFNPLSVRITLSMNAETAATASNFCRSW